MAAIFPAFAAPAQQQAAAAPVVSTSVASGTAEEISSRDITPTFRSTVNLVMVPVVVRDDKGNTVGNLRREDFRIFDNGKPQIIKQFSAESAARRAARAGTEAPKAIAGSTKSAPVAAIPRRFVAYVFDDLHLDTGDLMQARQAATRHMESLRPDDRIAVYTTSGQNMLEFTDDVAQVRAALLRVMAQPKKPHCPDLGPVWAAFLQDSADFSGDISTDDKQYARILKEPRNNSNPVFFEAMKQATACPEAPLHGQLNYLRRIVTEILTDSDRDSQLSLELLRSVIRRMSSLPGERAVVAVSPGFLTRNREEDLAQVIDRAIQARVVINSLDARGVYTPSKFDASANIETDGVPDERGVQLMFKSNEAMQQADVLENLADGTGGMFFHSNNDLNEGFRQTAGVVEYSYLLGFAPAKASAGDLYHKLKVKVEGKRNLSVQARRGYFVAKAPADPSEAARQQIENAMFSSDEIHELPIQIGTEVSRRRGSGEAALKVAVHLDLKQLPLRKVADRNNGDLELYAAVFDRNGNYLSGKGKKVELRLRDETLARLTSGTNLSMQFGLRPGSYVLRVVVREAEGQLMAAANKAVQIP